MIASIVDRLLEAPVAPSFTKVGYQARRALEDWTELEPRVGRFVYYDYPRNERGRPYTAEELA